MPGGNGWVRLRAGNTEITLERALQTLKRIQHHRVSVNGAQNEVFKALKVKSPSLSQQPSLWQGHVLYSDSIKS
jgi:hypothetical protein